ncbi:hypothetical protein O181_030235 [Austropuccinia psidii MF-1]|uniref:Uncharacterized protein n=1 Tax=Austropuccinia psidii MF-1 TaxID=1389203 RepID=A0A9Q3CWU4_9BASI|nr:hypothetical protein [Austropuccinia psidii MF-1]
MIQMLKVVMNWKDGVDFEVINQLVGHSSISSSTQHPATKFHSNLIPSTPRNFQPVLSSAPSSVPPFSPKSSITRAILASPIKPSPIPQPRQSQVLTSHQTQPVARTSQRRDNWSPLPFPDAQLFQTWEDWTIKVKREEQAVVNGGQYSLARSFRRVDRNSEELIVYSN